MKPLDDFNGTSARLPAVCLETEPGVLTLKIDCIYLNVKFPCSHFVQKHCPTCIVAAGLQDKPGLDVLKLRRFTETCCEDEASSDRTGGVEG